MSERGIIKYGGNFFFFFFFQAEDGIRDVAVTWSSDVCSSDLPRPGPRSRSRSCPPAPPSLGISWAEYATPAQCWLIVAEPVPTAATTAAANAPGASRSEERRVGKGWRGRGGGDSGYEKQDERA